MDSRGSRADEMTEANSILGKKKTQRGYLRVIQPSMWNDFFNSGVWIGRMFLFISQKAHDFDKLALLHFNIFCYFLKIIIFEMDTDYRL